MDKHVPIITKTITINPEAPRYNPEIDEAKQNKGEKQKRNWRKTTLTVHREIFVDKKENINSPSAKENYYTDLACIFIYLG